MNTKLKSFVSAKLNKLATTGSDPQLLRTTLAEYLALERQTIAMQFKNANDNKSVHTEFKRLA